MISLLVFVALITGLSSCSTPYSWPKAALVASRANPTPGKSEALGYYSKGCLKGAKTFTGKERGLILSQGRRGRFWGHAELIDILTELGEFSHKALKKKVVVGDLSLARGGPTVGGHSSHQNGLDVDIWFHLFREKTQNFAFWQTEEMKSALKDGSFGKEQVLLLSFLSQDKRVDRIFVHPQIKKRICEDRGKFDQEQLRKIRPWYGHDDHLHLRLKCPVGNPSCQEQAPPPAGDGCDQLDWWWSQEARDAEDSFDFSYKAARYKYMETTNSLPKNCQRIYEDVTL